MLEAKDTSGRAVTAVQAGKCVMRLKGIFEKVLQEAMIRLGDPAKDVSRA